MVGHDKLSRRRALQLGAAGLAGFSGLAGEASAVTGTWTAKRRLPTALSDFGSAVLGNKLYVFGGIVTGTGLRATNLAYSYTPSSNTWQAIPKLPQSLWGPCGVAAAGKVFSFGGAPPNSPYTTGTPPTDKIFVYRPGDGWTDLTATKGVKCPYPNWAMGGVYNPNDGLIYCMGGGTNVTDRESASTPTPDSSNPGRFDETRIWTFDPEKETVVNPDLARMPQAKRWPTAAIASVGGKSYVYAIGGYLGLKGATNTNFRFDPSTNKWSAMKPTPRAAYYNTRSNPVINNRIYLTHPFTGSSYLLATYAYNPETNTYDTNLRPPKYRRIGAGSGVIANTLYVVGGHTKPAKGKHLSTTYNEAFKP